MALAAHGRGHWWKPEVSCEVFLFHNLAVRLDLLGQEIGVNGERSCRRHCTCLSSNRIFIDPDFLDLGRRRHISMMLMIGEIRSLRWKNACPHNSRTSFSVSVTAHTCSVLVSINSLTFITSLMIKIAVWYYCYIYGHGAWGSKG